jgi:hypothetical protein
VEKKKHLTNMKGLYAPDKHQLYTLVIWGFTKYHDIYLFWMAFTIKSKFLIYAGLLKPHLNILTFKVKNKQAFCLPREAVTSSSTSCLLRKQLLP